MTPLAQWLHDRRIDCRWAYLSTVDVGLGRRYTTDHIPAHERDAAQLLAALSEVVPPAPLSAPQEDVSMMKAAEAAEGMS